MTFKAFVVELAETLNTSEDHAINLAEKLGLFPKSCKRFNNGECWKNTLDRDQRLICNGRKTECVMHSHQEYTKVLQRARDAVAKGTLASFHSRQLAEERTKHAISMVLIHWNATSIQSMFDWRKTIAGSPEFCEIDYQISQINDRMCRAYAMVEDAVVERADVLELDRIMTEALEIIADAEIDLRSYLNGNVCMLVA